MSTVEIDLARYERQMGIKERIEAEKELIADEHYTYLMETAEGIGELLGDCYKTAEIELYERILEIINTYRKKGSLTHAVFELFNLLEFIADKEAKEFANYEYKRRVEESEAEIEPPEFYN